MIGLFQARNSLPMICQSEVAECGLACLAMMTSFHGRRVDLPNMRSKFPMSARGACVEHFLKTAELLNLRARPLKLELEELKCLALPAILHWDLDHFVVLKKIHRRGLVIHDPARGIKTYSWSEMDLHFSGVAIEVMPAQDFKPLKARKSLALSGLIEATPSLYLAAAKLFGLSLLIQILVLLSPLYLQLVIDQGIAKGDMDIVLLLAYLFLFVTLAKIVVGYFRGKFLLQFSNQLGFALVSNVFDHLLHLPLRFFQRREIGDIVSRFSSLNNIRQLVTEEMITILVDGIFSVLTLVLLYLYSPLLTLVVVVSTVVTSAIRLLTIPFERNRRQEVLLASAEEQSCFIENVRNISVSKTYGIEQQMISDWQDKYARTINTGYHLGHFQLSTVSLQNLILGLDSLLTIYIGSLLSFAGELTLGQLMSFVFLKQHFSSSIMAMLPKFAELRLMELELERVSEIVLEPRENMSKHSSLALRELRGGLSAKELSFSYDADQNTLDRISFSLEPGQCMAIAGDSGCGKSTLIKILLGLEVPHAGVLLVDALPLARFGLVDYRAQVAAVLHGDGLLAGDLAYNLTLDRGSPDRDKLARVCQLVQIQDLIDSLPMGLSTQLGSLGDVFSAGQIQRILLARALYRQPQILFLDEALSHLSDLVAAEILSALKAMDITVVLVSHNPGLVAIADLKLELPLSRKQNP